jgi:hypothetical protein
MKLLKEFESLITDVSGFVNSLTCLKYVEGLVKYNCLTNALRNIIIQRVLDSLLLVW